MVTGSGFSSLQAFCQLATQECKLSLSGKDREPGKRARQLIRGGITFVMDPVWYKDAGCIRTYGALKFCQSSLYLKKQWRGPFMGLSHKSFYLAIRESSSCLVSLLFHSAVPILDTTIRPSRSKINVVGIPP